MSNDNSFKMLYNIFQRSTVDEKTQAY